MVAVDSTSPSNGAEAPRKRRPRGSGPTFQEKALKRISAIARVSASYNRVAESTGLPTLPLELIERTCHDVGLLPVDFKPARGPRKFASRTRKPLEEGAKVAFRQQRGGDASYADLYGLDSDLVMVVRKSGERQVLVDFTHLGNTVLLSVARKHLRLA